MGGDQLTLVRYLDGTRPQVEMEARYRLRDAVPSDLEQLGALYFESYEPGVACATIEEAAADVRASFDGAYGPYASDFSPVIETEYEIVAAIMTVEAAPWDDTPAGPFIIELFTDPRHRRGGLARALLGRCLGRAAEKGYASVSLRVLDDNLPALCLYRSLGFGEWSPGRA